jgi:hypothetical protein
LINIRIAQSSACPAVRPNSFLAQIERKFSLADVMALNYMTLGSQKLLRLRTIYGPRPFQQVQVFEDWSLGTGDMSGQPDCLKVKNKQL